MADNNNSPIKIIETQNKGRALVSTKPLIAGEIVLRDSPILLYSAVPHGAAAAAANYCSNCFRTISPTSPATVPCPNCSNSSIFCSPKCLSIALSASHSQFVCQALRRLFAADSPLLRHHPDRHLQARYLVAAYNLAIVSISDFQTLLSLQGEACIDEASVFLHSLISSIGGSLNLGEFRVSVELTAALLAKDRINAFGLMESFCEGKERSVRAYGVYPRASFFNHDCLPNACRFDYVDSVSDMGNNTDIVVRVIHDVPEGREICLSYFPVNLKYAERQKRLKEDYGFTCDCDRCNVEANWSDNEEEEGGEGKMDDEDEDMDEGGEDDDMESGLEAEDGGMVKENDDFPHAYFFVRYMCSRENCGGTLAPLPPTDARPSTLMECNVCGNVSNCEEMDGN